MVPTEAELQAQAEVGKAAAALQCADMAFLEHQISRVDYPHV